MAAAGITIRVNYADVQRALEGIKNGAPRAATRAINRTLVTVNAQVSREIARDVGLQVGVVKRALRVTKASFARLFGTVDVTGRRIPLIAFSARGPEPSRGRGRVTYRLGPGRRSTIAGAFIATMRSGHRGVFRRRAAGRLPIIELFGPSLPKVAAGAAILNTMKRIGEAALQKNLLAEVKFLVDRKEAA